MPAIVNAILAFVVIFVVMSIWMRPVGRDVQSIPVVPDPAVSRPVPLERASDLVIEDPPSAPGAAAEVPVPVEDPVNSLPVVGDYSREIFESTTYYQTVVASVVAHNVAMLAADPNHLGVQRVLACDPTGEDPDGTGNQVLTYDHPCPSGYRPVTLWQVVYLEGGGIDYLKLDKDAD
jgi:hypothetical protein